MFRWLEQWETKQAEYLRGIRYFQTMSKTWRELTILNADFAGRVAYAHKQADMFEQMAQNMNISLREQEGYSHLNVDGEILLSDVMARRRRECGVTGIVSDALR